MEQKLIKLLELIHQEALGAYLLAHNHSNSDIHVVWEPCYSYDAQHREKEISQLLVELKEEEKQDGS